MSTTAGLVEDDAHHFRIRLFSEPDGAIVKDETGTLLSITRGRATLDGVQFGPEEDGRVTSGVYINLDEAEVDDLRTGLSFIRAVIDKIESTRVKKTPTNVTYNDVETCHCKRCKCR